MPLLLVAVGMGLEGQGCKTKNKRTSLSNHRLAPLASPRCGQGLLLVSALAIPSDACPLAKLTSLDFGYGSWLCRNVR